MNDSQEIIIDRMRYRNIRSAALSAGISASYVSKFCREGSIKATRVDGLWYVNETSLRDFLEQRETQKQEWYGRLARERAEERGAVEKSSSPHSPQEETFVPLPRSRVAPRSLHRTIAQRRAEEESARRTVLVASIGGLLFFSTLGLAFSNVAPIAGMRSASVASIADVGSAFLQRFTSFVGSLFAVDTPMITHTLERTALGTTTTSAVTNISNVYNNTTNNNYITNNNQPISTSAGDVSGSLLDSRLNALENYLDGRLDFALYEGRRQTEDLADQFSDGIGGGGFDDIDITDSTWTGGSIAGASISGGSISGVTFSGTQTFDSLSTTEASSTHATTTNLYISGSFGFGSDTGLLRNTAGAVSTLANGGNGQVLKMVSGNLQWSTDLTGGGGGGSSFFSTTTDDLAIYPADPSQVVIIGDSATTTTGNILEVAGSSLFRNSVTTYGTLTAPRFIATSTTASILPYASTTAISSSYASSTQGFFGSLSVGSLSGVLKATAGAVSAGLIDLASEVTGILGVARGGTGWSAVQAGTLLYGNGSSALATTSAGTNGQVLALVNGVPGWVATTTFSSGLAYSNGNVTLDTSGNWGGTFDGLEGSAYLANSFSTTSANYWSSLGLGFSTTSANYWQTTRDFFSTSSANYFLSQNQGNAFSTSSAQYFLSVTDLFSTTSANYFVHSSTTIPKTYTSNAFTALQTFANASSTFFSSSYASTTNLFATTASTTNLTISGLSNGLLKVNASGVVSLATAGTDYSTFSYLFPNNATSTTLVFNNGLLSTASSTFTGNTFFPGGVWNSSGSVGIGTSTPWGALSVTNAGSGPSFIVEDQASPDDSPFVINAVGTVGIGTSSPVFKLDVLGNSTGIRSYIDSDTSNTAVAVQGNAGALLRIITYGTAAPGNMLGNTRAGNTFLPADGADLTIGTVDANFLALSTNSTERLRINSSGLVGIGTSTPWAKLSVESTAGIPQFVVGSSTATEFIVDSLGYVGIGTASPEAKLHLRDAVNITPDANGAGQFKITGSGYSGFTALDLEAMYVGHNSSARRLDLMTNETTRLSIAGTGNVGIGTTSPFAKLHVSTSGSGAGAVSSNADEFVVEGAGVAGMTILAGATSDASIFFGDSGSASIGRIVYDNNVNDLSFWTNATERMTINSSGNVGIGTTTPWANLSVHSSAGTPQFVIGSSTATQFIVDKNGNVGIGTANPSVGHLQVQGTTPGAQIYSVSSATTGTNYGIDAEATGSGATTNIGGYFASANGTQNYGIMIPLNFPPAGADNYALRINSTAQSYFAGNVGIGTTTPWGTLSITNAGSGPSFIVEDQASPDDSPFVVSSGGNVGIGTSSPNVKLDVYGNTAQVRVSYPGSTSNGAIQVLNDTTASLRMLSYGSAAAGTTLGLARAGNVFLVSDAATFGIGSSDANPLVLATNGAERLRIDSSGNIGIGTTTPISTLSVQGSLCVRSTGSCGATAGTIYATTAAISDIDLAENYRAVDMTLVPGEIVSLETQSSSTIRRAVQGEEALGVLSTKPGLLLGQEIKDGKPVALKGRVPLKVNMEGGPIAIGDRLTISSVPGIGTKATTSAYTIARALESSSTTGEIEVFVENEYTFIIEERNALHDLLNATSTASSPVFANIFARMTSWLADAGNGITEIFAKTLRAENVYADTVTANEICVKKTNGGHVCVTGDEIESMMNDTGVSVPTPEPEPQPTPEPTPKPAPELEEETETPEETPASDPVAETPPTEETPATELETETPAVETPESEPTVETPPAETPPTSEA